MFQNELSNQFGILFYYSFMHMKSMEDATGDSKRMRQISGGDRTS